MSVNNFYGIHTRCFAQYDCHKFSFVYAIYLALSIDFLLFGICFYRNFEKRSRYIVTTYTANCCKFHYFDYLYLLK